MFKWWAPIFHPGLYIYPLARACGGGRDDINTEGAGPILMNIPVYLKFLAWRIACGGGDGILEKNLFSLYRCVEKISLLRVLSILHMFIVMPLRWLSGNCEKLAEWDFGVADMPQTVDLMDAAFKKISEDGTLIYNNEFMESIFDPIKDKVTPFRGFYTYMF